MSVENGVYNDRLLSTRPLHAGMKVRWHGHSCFEFGDSQLTLVVDPHDGRSIGIKPPAVSADVVLMTHNHYDHNAVRAVRGRHDDILSREGMFTVKGLEVEGLPSWHDAVGGRERGPNTMYLFRMDDISVCHCGDLGCIPDEDVLSRIRNVDMLFVPVGETFTMPLPEVKRFLEIVNPNVIVPMHYRHDTGERRGLHRQRDRRVQGRHRRHEAVLGLRPLTRHTRILSVIKKRKGRTAQ